MRKQTRLITLGSAAALCLALAGPAAATDGRGRQIDLQLLSFNDYHGHLEATDQPLPAAQDPSQTPVGGAEHLAAKLTELRKNSKNSLTVAAGDLIGGSTFLSGMFHDEPAVETLNAMGLDVSSVGNHEFDEGTAELQRIVGGGCHPTDGCYFPDKPYAGTDYDYLAANVVRKGSSRTLLPATSIKKVQGVKVGFIGMTLEATDTLVSPAGVATVDFTDEVETANAQAKALRKKGVNAIVVLIHEGGEQTGTYDGCTGISGPIADMATKMDPAIDAIVSGHTHQPYVCSIKDPAGNPRMVTSAASYGRVVTETRLVLDRRTRDVVRSGVRSTNHLVTRAAKDATQTAIIERWNTLAKPKAARVVGTIAEDISGDASGPRGGETPMADVVADAILFGTGPGKGGAQIAFMNVGGVRASLQYNQITNGEKPGEVTYAEAYAVNPFGNLLVSMDLTGAQIKTILEEQYQPVAERGSRATLALGVSKGFTYTWDATKPQGSRVVAGSMKLNGTPLSLTQTYRVGTLNFLAEGGDLFNGFKAGTNVLGGPEDLANFTAYLAANPGLKAPADRIAGL